MLKLLIYTSIIVSLLAGCSTFVGTPVQEVKGENVVCILFNDKQFKVEVVKNLTEKLTGRGYIIVTDRINRAKFYRSSDYGAVVYMAEYWAWHIPWHAKKYNNKNNASRNIVFVITSGDPDVTIKEPFDAITSVSGRNKAGLLSQDILNKLEKIMGN